jgi:hypothetical protein
VQGRDEIGGIASVLAKRLVNNMADRLIIWPAPRTLEPSRGQVSPGVKYPRLKARAYGSTDTRRPSFSSSSLAMRSSPHVRFDAAIVAISRCTSAGMRGRPGVRDFQRQNSRSPFRCQRISVSRFTRTSNDRHSRNRDKPARTIRVESSARWGFAPPFLVQGELFSQEQILGRELGT